MKTSSQLSILVFATFSLFAFVAQGADYTYATNFGTITITKYIGPGGVVTIPSEINGLPVTRIGQDAFYSCSNLISVTIPAKVTSLGQNAFAYSSLTNTSLPESVVTIGNFAFHHCANLSRITIPNGVTSIGQYAFGYCNSLTTVTIGNSVTNLGHYAFGNCTSLTNVTIPDSVSSIGSSSFYNCTKLTGATLGSRVTSLEQYSFAYCSSLTGVYFRGNAPGAASSAFVGADNSTIYYLPGTTGWGTTFDGRPTALWVLSYPIILTTAPNFGIQSNRFGFNISWATNIPVVVEASVNLVTPTWATLSTNTLIGGTSYFSDAGWTNFPTRFYRLRSL